jgi:hypothetical protein
MSARHCADAPTLGATIKALVEQFGQSPNGIYILERALAEACFPGRSLSVLTQLTRKGRRMMVSETPGAIAAGRREKDELEATNAQLDRLMAKCKEGQ